MNQGCDNSAVTMAATSKSIMTWVKKVFAALILGAMFWFVGVEEMLHTLSAIRPDYLLYLLVLSYLLIWVSCVKWRIFIRASGGDSSINHLMKLYTIGYFVNLFSPSYLGGDLVRSYQLGTKLGNQRDALLSTFMERFTGLFAMCVLSLIFLLSGTQLTQGLEYAVLILGGSVSLGAVVFFSTTVSSYFMRLTRAVARLSGIPLFTHLVETKLTKIDQAFDLYRGNYRLVVKALSLSFLFHALTVLNTYVAGRAVGWENPSIEGLFVVVPLALIVGMVPLTPSGIGIQEGAFLFLLQRIGASAGAGLGVGLLLRAKAVLIGILGGILLASMKRREREEELALSVERQSETV